MAITAKKRKSLPASKFALPKQRKYPIDTLARAQNAKARATQQLKKGNISAATRSKIHAAANRAISRLKKSTGKKKGR